MIRDEILLNNSNYLLKKSCLSCNKFGHRIELCPIIHYMPNKEKIINLYSKFDMIQSRYVTARKKEKSHNTLKNLKKFTIRWDLFQKTINNASEISEKDNNNNYEDEVERKIFEALKLRSSTSNNLTLLSKNDQKRNLEIYENIENFETIKSFKTYYPQHNFSNENFQLLVKQLKLKNGLKLDESQSLYAVNDIDIIKETSKTYTVRKKLFSSKFELKENVSLYELVKLIMDEPKIKKILKKKK